MNLVERASLRIAHVEDDSDYARLAQVYLNRAGFKLPVTHYVDGHSAMGELLLSDREELPDVVLLDLRLPTVSGLEVLRCLRQVENTRSLPVFLLTTSTDPAEIQQLALSGATTYLFKGLTFRAVIDSLDLLITEKNGPAPESNSRMESNPVEKCRKG